MDKLFKNTFNFVLVLRNAGSTNIKTATKEIAGTIFSNPIFLIFPKIFGFIEEFFNSRVRFFIFYIPKFFK